MNSSLPVRVATWALALVIGAFYGLAGTIGHAYTLAGVPVGLAVAIIGSAALLVAVRLLTGDRWSTLATGLGMMVTTLVFSGEGPGGSVVVPQTEISLVWTFAVPVVVALVVAWPHMPSRDERAPRSA
ncbi:DUF6113 family protein [Microbacterium xanthum]|uniref:DUF6113 family protein n=1 Tax=Microbacterium xanthum TaxID=3079794 RepID=UPI002AD3C2F6|nr:MULTISPECIES: DUF6113 family protein [unclassified Microbacterium]MDZ8172136.1 DUF6113 family protein [Microbacterium sp. KSW-48]MDZ8202157.1 DUF6113 family protein [Microbacterium sp. SSW1-59]